jgi:hypothetical protein
MSTLHPEVDPEMVQRYWRNLEVSLKGMFEPGRPRWDPSARESKVRKRLIPTFVIYRYKYRGRGHGLDVSDHGAAFRTFRISPVRVSEPPDTVFDIVQVQDPIRSGRSSKTFAFHYELPAAFFWIRFISIKINPLKIGAFLFTTRPRSIIWIWLITAFSHRRDFIIGVQIPTRSYQAKIEYPIQVDFRLRKKIPLTKQRKRSVYDGKALGLTSTP